MAAFRAAVRFLAVSAMTAAAVRVAQDDGYAWSQEALAQELKMRPRRPHILTVQDECERVLRRKHAGGDQKLDEDAARKFLEALCDDVAELSGSNLSCKEFTAEVLKELERPYAVEDVCAIQELIVELKDDGYAWSQKELAQEFKMRAQRAHTSTGQDDGYAWSQEALAQELKMRPQRPHIVTVQDECERALRRKHAGGDQKLDEDAARNFLEALCDDGAELSGSNLSCKEFVSEVLKELKGPYTFEEVCAVKELVAELKESETATRA